MFKKIILNIMIIISIMPMFVMASDNFTSVLVNGRYYDTLEEAINNASSTDTIKLIKDISLDKSMLINKTVNIDLNGNDILAPETVFLVQGGTLNIKGNGTIKETRPNMGAIMVKGSEDTNNTNYSVVNVGEEVVLEGWSGIFVNHINSKAYGIKVNFYGKIKAVNDVSGGSGIGIYVNGNIKHRNNEPVINIMDGSNITSSGNGLYIAGYSTFNIGKSNISGIESGIAIKSGNLNIDGASIECNGEDKTPTSGNNNGINESGAAIQIESNKGYAGNINLNIKNGDFKSKNSNTIYEYISSGNESNVNSIEIKGGTFKSGPKKDVFQLTDSFKDKNKAFITGGKYSTDPSIYLAPEYKTILDNELYNVIKNTFKEETINNAYSSNNYIKWIIGLISILLISIILWINKKKILKIFS